MPSAKIRWVQEDDWEQLFKSLHPDGDATACVFRCRHCGKLGGYVDVS